MSDRGVKKIFFQFSFGDRHFTGSSAVSGKVNVKWRSGGIYRLKFLLVLKEKIEGKNLKTKP